MKKLITLAAGAVLSAMLVAQTPAPVCHRIKLSGITQDQIQAALNDIGQTNVSASNVVTFHIVGSTGSGFIISK